METRRVVLDPKRRWLGRAMVVLVLGAGCSPAVGNRPVADDGTDPAASFGQGKIRFRNPEMAAKYQAAKAAPRSFEPVFDYAKAVADASLASLVDKSCESCEGGEVRYKRRSELEPQYWPIIEDALAMLEALGNPPEAAPPQMGALVATKGRLLWLAGRSTEEQAMIDEYARAHPTAVAVIRRRLELLREDGATAALESQCARSRTKLQSAPEAARVELLTACVALHPDNGDGRSDVLDYATYLPNPSEAEQGLYRKYLVERCLAKVGSEETRCGQACACDDKDVGKAAAAKCKRGCQGCRGETAQKLGVCQQLGEAPPAPAPARAARAKGARPKGGPAKAAPASRPRPAPAKRAPPPKIDDPSAPQQAVL